MSRKGKTFFIITFILLIALISSYYFIYQNTLGQINTVEISEDEVELMINKKNKPKSPQVINILLLGIDSREGLAGARSDTIIIASVDKVHRKIKFTSIMRDTYSNIPGKYYDKINHSYNFGGPELTMKTVNLNYDMNITDFVTVDFNGLKSIIDSLGGVEIELSKSEANHLIKNKIKGIKGSGIQLLNGTQALAYSRIRYLSGGDYERTNRQRKVLTEIGNKILNELSFIECLSLLEELMPYVETSFSQSDIITLGASIFYENIKTIEDKRLPLSKYSKSKYIRGIYYLLPYSLYDNVKYLHKFIYEKEYIPSNEVENISKYIKGR